MGELLLELLSEEIPARIQRRAIEEFAGLVRDKLAAAEIPAQTLRGYVTPRRLTLIADGISGQQPDRSEERRGPRVGAPPQAIDGFLRAAGLAKIDECEIRDTGRGEFYFAVVERPGRPAAEILPELVRAAIGELPWPTSMRYPASSLRWVRPLVSVVSLFDGAVLKLALDQIPVGRTTRGHRFLSEGEIAVENAQDYLEKLEAAYVILDHDRRRDLIAADLDRLAKAQGLTVKPDPALLDEVAGLVEFPVVLMGAIDEASMALPPEVLATAMRTHQKYFSCLKADGAPAPRFLFVANNLTPDDGKTIIAGNERVLRARLADARFFWEQDRKIRLEDRVEALKQRVYYDKLGSMYDKAERMEKIATQIADVAYPGDPRLRRRAERAARLATADLSTGIVGEFPELQGIMGGYYARRDEDPDVAFAIGEHYKPQGPNDTCPRTRPGIVVALADKVDTLVSFFAIGERPTGSRDPFALRRAALGTIRLIIENGLRISLSAATDFAISARMTAAAFRERAPIVEGFDIYPNQLIYELPRFIIERWQVHLRESGVRHELLRAVVDLGDDDLVRLLARVRALEAFLNSDDGANLLTAYRRASNIVAIEEKREGRQHDGAIVSSLLQQPEERVLAFELESNALIDSAVRAEQFDEAMVELARLRQPVDAFFDKVIVNVGEPELRENRLRLLSRIRDTMNQVADFSQIEG